MSVEKYSKIIKELLEVEPLSKDRLREYPSISEEKQGGTLPITIDELREMILEEIREEAEKLKRESIERGFNEGKEEGIKIYLQEMDNIRIFFENLKNELDKKLRDFIESLTTEAVALSLKVASKVVATYVEVDQNLVARLLKETFYEIGDSRDVKVLVNPLDLEVAKRVLDELAKGNNLWKINIQPSSEVSKGGCIVETSTRFIDNQVDTRFNQLVEEIKGRLMEEGESA
ncbi:MAG: FliH/SctL family protein [Candidatus Hydrogenedentes bacterium]|nr:FliH/SctL family protein [Candidatus Hydrogenedentota bacterium]